MRTKDARKIILDILCGMDDRERESRPLSKATLTREHLLI